METDTRPATRATARDEAWAPSENLIWRFYIDPAHRWRWQRLAVDHTVVETLRSGYAHYEACVANAGEHGYAALPSRSTKPIRVSSNAKRTYTPLAVGRPKAGLSARATIEQPDEATAEDEAPEGGTPLDLALPATMSAEAQ
jgi:hypothetical protein